MGSQEMVPDLCKTIGDRIEGVVEGLNGLVEMKCPGCGYLLGHDSKIVRCEHPLHLAVEALVGAAVASLHLGCCVRCGKISSKPMLGMAYESAYLPFRDRWLTGLLYFCWPCYYITHDVRP